MIVAFGPTAFGDTGAERTGRRGIGVPRSCVHIVMAFLVLFWTGFSEARAQQALSDTEREEAIISLAQLIEDEFYDEGRAALIADALRDAHSDGEFAHAAHAMEFAEILTRRLHTEDRHFAVEFIGRQAAAERINPVEVAASTELPNDPYAGMRRSNFRFARVEILQGNIGYIDFRGFAPIEAAEETARAALDFVAHADAIIFDLRRNRGGSPSMVQYLVSHFVEPGGETLINTFASRGLEQPEEMWSLPSHPAGHRIETPIYILTSSQTISAAEAFAYHLQAMGRGSVIGESTYGAGNPGSAFVIAQGYSIFISTGTSRNPITGTNWEGVGVQPDTEISAEHALDRAIMEAYLALAGRIEDPRIQRMYVWASEEIEARLSPHRLSAEALARYEGDFGVRDVWVENERLMYQREGREPNVLIPLGEDRFMFADDNAYRLVFRMNSRGRVIAMDLQVIDGEVVENRIVH